MKFATITGFGGGILSFLVGGIPLAMKFLIVLIFADIVTGLIAGAVERKLSSKVSWKGMPKKVGIFILIMMGHMLDMLMNTGDAIRDSVVFFYIVNESVSILENVARAGLPIPDQLRQAMEVLKTKKGDK